ncbi:MAG: SDR family oxidoreductase [Rhodospirillaceae bacterium]|nr:SDR family oxidoreductase [Rhodospirillaceae bacterium]
MVEAETNTNERDVALIIGGGPGISASCARLFAQEGLSVAVAARNIEKPVLQELASTHDVACYSCDAADPSSVTNLFATVAETIGVPKLVVHNIDGRVSEIFRKGITEADADIVLQTIRNGAYSAFLVAQQAAKQMLARQPDDNGHRGTIIFTNASAAMKGYPNSGAFAMACHAKAGLAQSMARELMPQGIHIAHVPIDAAIGWTQEDGTRKHRRAGADVDDNLANPDHIAATYLHLHKQHRSTWTFEVILRPWMETW